MGVREVKHVDVQRALDDASERGRCVRHLEMSSGDIDELMSLALPWSKNGKPTWCEYNGVAVLVNNALPRGRMVVRLAELSTKPLPLDRML
jgi:hypothetical protein